MYSVIANLPIPLILFAKRNLTARAIFIIGLLIAVQQCLKAFVEERGDGLRSKTHESVLFERSEFTDECAGLFAVHFYHLKSVLLFNFKNSVNLS